MTTVAYDGITMAADSRTTGDYKDDHCQKLFRVGKAVIGVAGAYSAGLLFIRWFKDQTKPKPDLPDDFYALVARDGIWFYDSNLIPIPTRAPTAIGSGAHLALGAMAVGATAAEAVRIARQYDESTGGRVRTLKVNQ